MGFGHGSADTLWGTVLGSSVSCPCDRGWWLLAVRVIPSADFNFEVALPVMTNSFHLSASRSVPAPPSCKFSTQAALRIDPSVICPMDIKRKRPGIEMVKYKSCTVAVWSNLR